MPSAAPSELRIKPRVLIADDSRIVRAMLIKHIHGLFEFREAVDGEQAWDTLLADSGIRVLITDLMMPKLDGYGLLRRIRACAISRIRELPVIVISGSDQLEERERARAAGATDLITKGVATAQLLSRVDALARLSAADAREPAPPAVPAAIMPSPELAAFLVTAEAMRALALQRGKNFALLQIAVDAVPSAAGRAALEAIGALLQRIVRQTDCVARSGTAEFTLATHGIDADAARAFAQRICTAVAGMRPSDGRAVAVGCGVACLHEEGAADAALADLRAAAARRARQALRRGAAAVVGAADDAAERF